jgi:hypothetical protein
MTEADSPLSNIGSWGASGAKLLRTMRLEASRSGHESAQPAHILVAALDQPEVHQAMRSIGQRPNVYELRSQLVSANLAPVDFDEDAPIGALAQHLLGSVRQMHHGDEPGLLYLLALKSTLDDQACRVLMRRAGLDTDLLDAALSRID